MMIAFFAFLAFSLMLFQPLFYTQVLSLRPLEVQPLSHLALQVCWSLSIIRKLWSQSAHAVFFPRLVAATVMAVKI